MSIRKCVSIFGRERRNVSLRGAMVAAHFSLSLVVSAGLITCGTLGEELNRSRRGNSNHCGT